MATGQSTVAYRDIPGFPGYRVGDDGSVWSRKAKGGNDRRPGRLAEGWRRLSLFPNSGGHLHVNLFRDGKGYIFAVHRLVLEAFVGPCPPGKECCHYPDQDKRNNRLENLRWDTPAENMFDKCRARVAAPTHTCTRCRQTKLTADMSKCRHSPGGLSYRCKSCTNELARIYRRRRATRGES